MIIVFISSSRKVMTCDFFTARNPFEIVRLGGEKRELYTFKRDKHFLNIYNKKSLLKVVN